MGGQEVVAVGGGGVCVRMLGRRLASFKDLDAADKADFVQAWQLAKAKAIGAS